MGSNFVTERFENAKAIIMAGKSRFYKTNLYDPLERKKGTKVLKLWDKLQDSRKLNAFYAKMFKAEQAGGNNDFGSEFIKRQSFIDAMDVFPIIFNSKDLEEIKTVIDNKIIPFIKECEREELFGGDEQ